MTETWFYVVAVAIGAIVLATVLWIFVQSRTQKSVVLSTTLTLVGFALVSTPLWGSIAIKGPQWEINLLRRTAETQLQTNVDLLQTLKKSLPADKAAQISPELNKIQETVNTIQKMNEEQERAKKILELVNTVTKITATVAVVP